MVSDMMSALEKIDAWKRLQDLPDTVDELNQRMASLEDKFDELIEELQWY